MFGVQDVHVTTGRSLSTALVTAALASAGAGLIHAAAAGSHADNTTLAWLFALCAVAQIGWAALVVVRPHPFVVAAGVVVNAGCVAVWALTRTVGLGGAFGGVEEVGFQDLLAAVLATVAAVGGGLALARPGRARRLDAPAIAVASFLVLVLTVPAMAAGHAHDEGHSHEDGTASATASARTHTHDDGSAHEHAATPEPEAAATPTPTGTITSLDDPRLTTAQRRSATTLLETTRAGLRAFPDEAAVVAAGYTSIGDGRRLGSFEHFVNRAYVADGIELDPLRIESIVMHVQDDGTKRVASAMYILSPGKAMADAPDIAGALTPWHDHQNLCWDETGTRLAGILVNGVCRPGGTFRGTAPMMHVWLENTPCGPFAGIEGHGGSCEHTHPS
jgi:hypothetical protein